MVGVSRQICHWLFRRGSGESLHAETKSAGWPRCMLGQSQSSAVINLINVIASHILQNTDSDDQKNAEYQPNVSQPIVTVYTHVSMYNCTLDSSVSKVLQKITFYYQIFEEFVMNVWLTPNPELNMWLFSR